MTRHHTESRILRGITLSGFGDPEAMMTRAEVVSGHTLDASLDLTWSPGFLPGTRLDARFLVEVQPESGEVVSEPFAVSNHTTQFREGEPTGETTLILSPFRLGDAVRIQRFCEAFRAVAVNGQPGSVVVRYIA